MKDLWAAVPGPMEGWSVARAKQWLVEVSMEDIYADGFAEAQVDGEILATLTLEELLVDVLEVDPDDIDDAMRAEHMGLLAQVAEAREALSRSAGHLGEPSWQHAPHRSDVGLAMLGRISEEGYHARRCSRAPAGGNRA